METVLTRVERLVGGANYALLELAGELERGDFDGKGYMATARVLAANEGLQKALMLLFAADGVREPAPLSIAIQ
ncbi:MAG: hypothetical protein KUL86_06955 [Castellaniella sp.]|nr:hypothetical protein [Castellaniella sp.]